LTFSFLQKNFNTYFRNKNKIDRIKEEFAFKLNEEKEISDSKINRLRKLNVTYILNFKLNYHWTNIAIEITGILWVSNIRSYTNTRKSNGWN